MHSQRAICKGYIFIYCLFMQNGGKSKFHCSQKVARFSWVFFFVVGSTGEKGVQAPARFCKKIYKSQVLAIIVKRKVDRAVITQKLRVIFLNSQLACCILRVKCRCNPAVDLYSGGHWGYFPHIDILAISATSSLVLLCHATIWLYFLPFDPRA